jgi:hypothetical protein
MITQFHGIERKCMTMVNLAKSRFDKIEEWQRVFHELAEALLYVHKKKFLHNDIIRDENAQNNPP